MTAVARALALVQPCPRICPELGTGGVGPHGATKYSYDAGNPSTTKFPPYYDGAVFFGEFTRDYLKEIRLDSQGRVQKINNLLDCGAVGSAVQPFECDNPMDLQFGADGSFYLLSYGDGFFNANLDAGMYRFSYVKGQRAPQAVLTATPTDGLAPLHVQFSSEGSRDPDPADSIRLEWDFDGDGTTDSIDPNPAHTYTTNGVYEARLTVTDSSGKTDSKTTVITVGNTSPTVTIDTPVDGSFFEFGQEIPFSVTVTDPEDGSAVECVRVEVTFVLVHDTHGHGEDSVNGCTGVLHTDAADASHGGYLAGGVSVSYTDNGANGQPPLTTVRQHVVQLRRQEVEFAQEQSGTAIANTADAGGGQHRNSLDPGDWIALNNRFDVANATGLSFRFANNAAAGTPRGLVEVRLDSVTGPVAAACTLAATGSNNTFASQQCAFTSPVSGSRRVYLVFQQAAGGPATNFGNLNWVEFTAPANPQ